MMHSYSRFVQDFTELEHYCFSPAAAGKFCGNRLEMNLLSILSLFAQCKQYGTSYDRDELSWNLKNGMEPVYL